MYRFLAILGGIACLPYVDFAYGFWELSAWLPLAAAFVGTVCYAVFLRAKKWYLVIPHLVISGSFFIAFYLLTLPFPIGGPGTMLYNYYSAKKLDGLQAAFLALG